MNIPKLNPGDLIGAAGEALSDTANAAKKAIESTAKDVVEGFGQSVETACQESAETAGDCTRRAAEACRAAVEQSQEIAKSTATSAQEELSSGYDALVQGEVVDILRERIVAGVEISEELAETICVYLGGLAPDWNEVGEGINEVLMGIQAEAQGIARAALTNEYAAQDGQKYIAMPDGSVRRLREDEEAPANAIQFVNGVATAPEGARGDARALAEETGRPVVLTYNATQGLIGDVLQAVGDKVDPFGFCSQNKATDELTEQMIRAARGDGEVDFIPYSQGTIVARNSLIRTHTRLFTEKFIDTLLTTNNPFEAAIEATRDTNRRMQNIHVVTAAPAAWLWPPYGNVEHVTNSNDFFVANALGQAAWTDPFEFCREVLGWDISILPDREDLTVVNETDGEVNHGFQDVYLDDVAAQV